MRNRPHHVAPSIQTARVALVYKAPADAGYAHVGLGRTCAATAKVLRAAGIWAEIWGCVSPDALLERLRSADCAANERSACSPTHVVIAAPWISTPELQAIAAEFVDVEFVVTSHSNWGFLAADPYAVKLMREAAALHLAGHNIRPAGNCERFAQTATRILGVPVPCLPNLVDTASTTPSRAAHVPTDVLRVGLFGAARILKNGLTAAAAAIELATLLRLPLELHINSGREDGGTVHAIEELTAGIPNVRLVNDGWLEWSRFQALLQHMHLVLQPSFTESFNCVVAESIMNGIPAVGSDAIEWLPPRWQARADDLDDVVRVAEYLIRCPRAIEDARNALERYAAEGLRKWESYLARA